MTEWHSKMQSYFPITEKIFPKIVNQIKERRADIFIKDNNYVIEIQHSNIDYSEVICRTEGLFIITDIKIILVQLMEI